MSKPTRMCPTYDKINETFWEERYPHPVKLSTRTASDLGLERPVLPYPNNFSPRSRVIALTLGSTVNQPTAQPEC